MDGRRFDVLARACATGRSRRGMLRGLAGITAAGLLGRTKKVEADGDGTDIPVGGGTSGGGACVPTTRPSSQLSGSKPPYPASIVAGTCENPNFDTTYALFDVTSGAGSVGAPTAAPVYQSATTVRLQLKELLNDSYSVVVKTSADGDAVLACGDIGGIQTGEDLTVGMRERNNSNHTGFAWLRGTGTSTLVYVFLGRGLSSVQTASAGKGSKVVTTADVNLRADASEDSDVVAIIPAGTELTVTDTAKGDWVPVKDSDSGDSGFVSSQYLVMKG